MTVIDHEIDTIFTNDSIPIHVGWVYRLMGCGDDYVIVTGTAGKYVTLAGYSGTSMDATILRTAFDNIIKEVA